ncbi:hypothetical protein GCM10023185_35110 [Hymenobacter saemangeumensis]|uniref:Translocation/assembly module TamB n=1 Tax=Hymenobacter saemangeumensis TaxID=1084522 RepID=A0ABP8IPA7_9BACT
MKHFAAVIVLFGALLGLHWPALAQTAPPANPPATGPKPPAQPAAATKYMGKLSTDPVQYISDIQLMMAATNNLAARNSAARLKELWGSNRLTSSQQARIIALSQTMLAKKFKPRPHFEALFDAVVGGANTAKLSDQQMDQFLEVFGKTLDNEAVQETDKFLLTASRVLSTGFVYRSGYNGLRAVGGNISFAYSPIAVAQGNLEFGAPQPVKEEVIPDAPKPAPKPAAKTAAKPAAKPAPKPAPKKKASSNGWDSADMWSSSSGGGWGNDDGWGKADDGWGAAAKKPAPKKPVAKGAPAKTTPVKAAAPAKEAAPKANPADFDSGGFDSAGSSGSFQPSASPYEEYYAPPIRGAVMVLKDTDLFMSTVGDSVFLRKVSGTIVPNSNRFVATSAQLSWNIKNEPVLAEMTGFDFDMTKPEFTAQPVTLTYAALLEAPVKGALSYKSTRRKPGAADNGYPRFISLTNDARIKTLGENIKYRGGLSLAGSRMLSAALDGSLSNITVSLEGKPKFKAASRAYVLGDSVITATRAGITIYQGAKDSITHPGVEFKYAKNKQQLKLSREEGMYKNTPYTDTYHQLDIRTQQLSWNLRNPIIEFAVLSAKNQQTADFESKEFFTNSRYQQLKSINRMHPLQMVVGFSQSHDNAKTVNILDIATELEQSPANLRSAMAGLARDGYVSWNGQTGEVTILPKGFHYVASARDRKDYDHIAIKSLTGSGRNATLNLNTNELVVRGVDRFNFTDDSASVFVRPDSNVIRIQRNRNINFNGTVVASAMRFKGRDFKFDYDGFYVDMTKIDSIVIRKQGSKAKGAKRNADFALTNKGSVSTGRLYINDPRNKSGRKKKPQYPSFDSKSGANVYFGKQDVLGGAYDSTLVFDIPPFKLDSLNRLGKAASGFDGVFRSGGILPDIKTKLTIQEDGSLGFVYDAPREGFPLYKGRGHMDGKVKLDSKGLQTIGGVKYQSGTFTSDAFILYRDSVVAVGRSGAIAAKSGNGVDIPKMSLPAGYLMKWDVKRDSMYLTTPENGGSARLYATAKTAFNFTGTAVLTPKAAGGSGRLDGPQSYIRSPEFTFKSDSYSGRRALLSVKSAEANKPALTATDVAFDYNLKKGYADFRREEGSKAAIDLPYSQFKSTLSDGRWDFTKKTVKLRAASGSDSTKKAYFVSTNPAQNGLRFKASAGIYDLAKYRLQTSGVPYVAAADAWILPDSGKVTILANGQVKPLRNAGLVLDSLSKIHKLYKGTIRVYSRNAFGGDAYYNFKTATDSVALHFTNFEPDPAYVMAAGTKKKKKANEEVEEPSGPPTVATSIVDAKLKFQLVPLVGYRGNVTLNSKRPGLIFDGEVQLQFGKQRASAEWFAVKDSIDPQNFSLTLREPKAGDGSPLVTGLYMSDVSNKVYPLYVATVPNSTDIPLFKVDGELRYNKQRREFTLSRTDMNDANNYQGAAMTYGETNGRLDFRGPLTFITSNKNYGMVASGVGSASPDSARYSIDALLGIDINLPPKALDMMANELAKITKNSPEALEGNPNELYKIGEFAGSKAAETYASRRGVAEPLAKLSPKLAHTLLLSKVDLRWSEKQKAWYSVGKLGLSGVGKQATNALIDGYVEIKRENATDVVELYLEAEPQVWYYFKYANNLLLTKSQNENYDAEIGNKAKGDYNTATSYGVFLGEYTDVDMFRAHFQRDYLGKSGKLAARPPAPPRPEPLEDGKKKKKGKYDDAINSGTEPGTDPAASIEEPAKKKKKKAKDNDPFGDGEIVPAGAAEDAAAAKKEAERLKKEEEKAAKEAAKEAERQKKEEEKRLKREGDGVIDAPGTAPAAGPATDPGVDAAAAKKEADRLKKEEEKAAKEAAKEAERQKKEEEKAKKEEEKRKKAAENDPFGGG